MGATKNASVAVASEPVQQVVEPVVAEQVETAAVVQQEVAVVQAPKAETKAEPKKQESKKETEKSSGQHSAQQGSVLRVDSRRVDYLMNLVSETVITKAAFNQIAIHLSDELAHFQSVKTVYSEKIRKFFFSRNSFFESSFFFWFCFSNGDLFLRKLVLY